MLSLTRDAHEAIRALRSHPRLSKDAGLRISVDPDRDRLVVRPATRPGAADRVAEVGDARVFVGPVALPRVMGRALHVRRDSRGRWQFGVLRRGSSGNGS